VLLVISRVCVPPFLFHSGTEDRVKALMGRVSPGDLTVRTGSAKYKSGKFPPIEMVMKAGFWTKGLVKVGRVVRDYGAMRRQLARAPPIQDGGTGARQPVTGEAAKLDLIGGRKAWVCRLTAEDGHTPGDVAHATPSVIFVELPHPVTIAGITRVLGPPSFVGRHAAQGCPICILGTPLGCQAAVTAIRHAQPGGELVERSLPVYCRDLPAGPTSGCAWGYIQLTVVTFGDRQMAPPPPYISSPTWPLPPLFFAWIHSWVLPRLSGAGADSLRWAAVIAATPRTAAIMVTHLADMQCMYSRWDQDDSLQGMLTDFESAANQLYDIPGVSDAMLRAPGRGIMLPEATAGACEANNFVHDGDEPADTAESGDEDGDSDEEATPERSGLEPARGASAAVRKAAAQKAARLAPKKERAPRPKPKPKGKPSGNQYRDNEDGRGEGTPQQQQGRKRMHDSHSEEDGTPAAKKGKKPGGGMKSIGMNSLRDRMRPA
jgi:hypothetical protein